MQSSIMPHVAGINLEPSAYGRFSDIAAFKFQYAESQLLTIDQGQVLAQTFSHYIAHLEFSSHHLNNDATFNFSVSKRSIFLLIMMQGEAVFFKRKDQFFSETMANSFYLIYADAGEYQAEIKAGEHKILLLTLRPDWLISYSKTLHKFKPLVENYLEAKYPIFTLPHCPYTKFMQKSLLRLQQAMAESKLSSELNLFINKTITGYHSMLVDENFVTSFVHHHKAEELKEYIKANLASDMVNDVAGIASALLVSKKTLLRLAKESSGIPLHELVISYRMAYAMKYLIFTNKSVGDVAELIGYKDTHYFSRAFKKYYGVPPSGVYRPFLN